MHTRQTALLALAAFTTPIATVTAQQSIDERLVGTWVGTGASNGGAKVVVARDHVVIDGMKMAWRLLGKGRLEIGPAGQGEQATYQIQGDKLTIRDSEETTTWRRARPADRPVVRPIDQTGAADVDNPLDGPSDNPLDPPAKLDAFARTFAGDGIQLVLTPTTDGYRGELALRGRVYPVAARADGTRLTGNFAHKGRKFGITATLEGDQMTLKSGRSVYRLKGAPQPQRGGNGSNPQPIEHAPGTKPLTDKTADVACRVPEAWSVIKSDASGCILNPGFQRGQTLDVTVSLHCLPLDAASRNRDAAAILQAELASTRQSLEQNAGIRTAAPQAGVQTMTVAGKTAAFVLMQAQTNQGRKGVVWFALRIEGDKCLALNSIFLDGKEAALLPQVKSVFTTLTPNTAAPATDSPRRTDGPAPQKGTVLLKKRSFRDPGFGNMESHTMLVPADWRGNAGVQWTQAPLNYVHFVGSFEGPDQSSITFDYNRYFGQSTSQAGMNSIRQQVQADRTGSSQIAWPPQQRGQMAVQHIIPRLRPNARNIQLKDVRTFPKAEAQMRKNLQHLIQVLQNGHTMDFHAERALVTYEQDGKQWEEIVQYTVTINKVMFRAQYVNFDTGLTEVNAVRTFRAPAGELMARFPQLRQIADTLRQTPRWSLSLNKLRMEISKIQHRGRMDRIRQFGEHSRRIAKTYSEISDSQMASWRRQQASSDRIQKARVNSILDVHDYRSTDGTSIQVNNSYDRVFQDAQGNLLMTNDVNYDPRTDTNRNTQNWTPLQRIQHLGR